MLFGKYVNKYYLKYCYLFIIGIIALIAVDYYQLKIPEIYGSIIDGLSGKIEFNKETLLSFVKEMFIIMVVMISGRFLWRICISGVSIRIENDLREKMFNYSKDLSQDFYSEHKTGALMALYINDLQTVRMCFGNGTVMLIDAIFLGVISFVKMLRINVVLSFLSCIPLVLVVIGGGIVSKYMHIKWKARQEAFEEMSDFTQESFSGLSVIRAFVKEAKELRAFSKINKDNVDKNMDFVKFSTMLNVVIELFIQSIVVIIVGFGGYLVYTNGEVFTVGRLNEFIGYFNSIIWPMMAVARLINLRSQGTASLKRITDLLDNPITVKDGNDLTPVEEIKGGIVFNDLSFSYPGSDQKVLHNISFEIKPGESIGIIGATGSGKTTLVDLLLRIYNLEEGKIFIDGKDIMHIPLKQVRDIVSYVPQDNFLFSEKIRSNIAFAFKNSSIEDVKYYAQLADVDENIEEFKDKYDTILGERGVTVSGGQKQRISIARALMKNSSILILDDSVSAVDTKTEEKILDNLHKERKNKTTILVAHRISTVKSLDKILLIDDGRVVAFGSHEELQKTCEAYRHMVEMQRLEDLVGGEA